MKNAKNILLVDDDEIYVFLTKRIIEETNLVDRISVFGNGKEAIDFLRSNADDISQLPEIIFLDLSMPIMDGWDFLEEYILLKPKLGKTITIYIISSSISPYDLKRAKEISEVSDFIIKPISKLKFTEIIKSLK